MFWAGFLVVGATTRLRCSAPLAHPPQVMIRSWENVRVLLAPSLFPSLPFFLARSFSLYLSVCLSVCLFLSLFLSRSLSFSLCFILSPSKVPTSLLAGRALSSINSAKSQIWLATVMLRAQTLGIDPCVQMEVGVTDIFSCFFRAQKS